MLYILGTPLIMVLGHERCGAVTAVQGKRLRSYWFFVKAIKPAISKTEGELDDPVDNAVVQMVSNSESETKFNYFVSTIAAWQAQNCWRSLRS